MTLGEGKRKVYKLLDEYSSGGSITQDADIENKMADFFDIAQKELAQIKRIVKLVEITREAGVTAYEPPEDFMKPYRIWRDGEIEPSRYDWKGGKLIIPEADTAAVIELEYFACPATIDAETPDEQAFEIAEDAAQAMPFFVAAQQLIVDLVVDYQALLQIYHLMISDLDRTLPGESPVGRVRQRFFRVR